MKQGSPTTLDVGIQQQKSFDASKVVVKENNGVKNAIKETVAKVDEKVGNDNKVNNDNNDNLPNPQPIDKQIPVQPMEISNENEIKSVVTNGNDQNFIDINNINNNNNNNKSKSKSNNINDNDNNNNNNKDDSNGNGKKFDEFDEMANKELLSKLSATLAEFYGGGDNYDEIEEPQKKRPRSCAKVSSIILTKEGENTDKLSGIKIRDFAYPTDDPRHWGQTIEEEEQEEQEEGEEGEEEEYSEYVNRRARALYDFEAENETELSFQEGDILLIQYLQFDGWLMANLGEESGLVPLNYVSLLGDEDEDEYGNWAEEGNNVEQED